ncbi:MAG: ketoacyl-ACP synthase III, partial [Verrucomicrobia bacterium]|nr:ketoacyl-ACP synthase III [Verrucomicrobiota bacterium]
MTDESKSKASVAIVGTGAYLPERILTNAELEEMVDTTDEWIVTRTGMRERRIAGEDESTSVMAAGAAKQALASAGLEGSDVDLIIVGTVTPDMPFPSTACLVQDALGAKKALCFDLEAACSGFLYAMEVGRGMLLSGLYETALVIGAEKMSTVTDWEDRATCVLFGDGAGAVVLKRTESAPGILATSVGADGSLGELLMIPAGGSRTPASHDSIDQRLHFMKMAGNNVFKHAVRCMCEAGRDALEKAGLGIEDVDWVVPHQANMRIIQAISDRVGISMDHFVINLDRLGNTTAATVPLALD